ncbi:MAG TPA: hypothetical protein VI547_03590 [Anaerolineales bacterium]|nr:hypothetical protein [Anaerolineales bacterium]
MELELIPALQTQRELYALPRGFERFWKYIETMTGGTDDLVLPITGMNPMGHEHNAQMLDSLIAFGAEEVARATIAEAAGRLAKAEGSLRVCLVVVDDARGQWTNRYFVEMSRLQSWAEVRRGFATVSVWTSGTWDAEAVRRETLVVVYRNDYLLRFGVPKTLRQIMKQEGLALAFAGTAGPTLDADDLAYSREVIAPYLEATVFPTIFSCLYGDEIAKVSGYTPLGLSARAGYAVALEEARQSKMMPERVLEE